MKNFFTVIVILAVSIFIFAFYYTSKNIYNRFKQQNIKSDIKKKRYEDEKKYLRNYLRTLINELSSGKLSWVLISSRLYPEAKIELIYNSFKKSIQIQHRIRNVSNEELSTLRNLGLQAYEIKDDLFCIDVSLNSKIITDIIYFILEHLSEQRIAQNLKIVTSGGYY